MDGKDLFKQIEKLEESSNAIEHESMEESLTIKENSKKELELFLSDLQNEKRSYLEKKEAEYLEEEKEICKKHTALFHNFTASLNEKYQSNLNQVTKLFIQNTFK